MLKQLATGVPGSGEAWPDAGGSRFNYAYPRSPRLMFLVFIAFVVARYVQANYRLGILSAIRFEFLLGGLAVVLGLIYWPNRRIDIQKSRPVYVAIILLFASMIVQLPMAADPVLARTIFNDRAFKFALLTFLIVAFIECPQDLRYFQVAFLFSIFYITLEATQGLISGSLYWQNQGVMRLHGAVPLYGHPNSLGGVALGSLPFLWYYWPEVQRFYFRLAILACAATSLVCVIYSGSRTAYVGLLGLVFWMWLQSRKKIRFTTRLLVVGAVTLMVIPHQYIERFETIGGKEKEGNSKGKRVEILQDAWTIFQENPLGIGVASFPAKRAERFGRSQDTHNLYLEVATNLGIQGLVIFLVLVGTIMVSFSRAGKSFERTRSWLARETRQYRPRGLLMRSARRFDRDLSFCIATARAGGGFVFVRLVLGLFGMDLYEIYWWYAAGLAIVLTGLSAYAERLFRSYARALRTF